MKISIVIAVLNSHEVVRRQVLHFEKMPLPGDVELIIVDDGSDEPIKIDSSINCRVLYTNDKTMWTQPAARNFGVKYAKGEYVICTDVDHILTYGLIDFVRNTKYDFIRFRREVAVLDENGDLVQTQDSVLKYGYDKERLNHKGFRIVPHTNSFAVRRDIYLGIGGVSEKHVGSGKHPNREEQPLKRAVKKMERDERISVVPDNERPIIYMIPNGRYCGDKDYNPFNLFHNLKRMTRD